MLHSKDFLSLTTLPEISDTVLADQVLQGDQRAFEKLVTRYQTPVFNYIYHIIGQYDQACDISQQVFMRFYQNLPGIDYSRPLKPWLLTVAHNCCIDATRREQSHIIYFSQLEDYDKNAESATPLGDIPDTQPLPEEILEQHDLQKTLLMAINSLPPKYQQVVMLRYTAQLRFSEIGQVLNIPSGTAKTYFGRAKKQLRAFLAQHQGSLN